MNQNQGTSGTVIPADGAPGLTSSTITIGVLTNDSYSEAASNAGINAAATGDQKAMAQSVIDYLNAHGGIAGRRIVPVFFDINLSEEQSNEPAEEEAACDAFTENNHVFAVASIVGFVDETFYSCLQAHKVIVSTTGELTTERFLDEFPDILYQPADVNYTRILSDNVQALWSAGWFGASPKVGVVGLDTADAEEAVTDGLEPALAAHGLKLTASFYVADSAQGDSDYSNAVLRFKSEGINKIFFSEGGQVLLFATAAQSQDYFPTYEMDSRQDPAGEVQSTAPADELNGSMGIGWIPFEDVDYSEASQITAPGESTCRAALAAADQNLSAGATAVVAMWTCDGLFFLRDASAEARNLSLTGFRSAVQGLGYGGFEPASTFQSYFAPGRTNDGASAYRLVAFNNACSCFRYVSALKPLD